MGRTVTGAVVSLHGFIARRLFDLTNGWDGKPAASEHVYVQMRR